LGPLCFVLGVGTVAILGFEVELDGVHGTDDGADDWLKDERSIAHGTKVGLTLRSESSAEFEFCGSMSMPVPIGIFILRPLQIAGAGC